MIFLIKLNENIQVNVIITIYHCCSKYSSFTTRLYLVLADELSDRGQDTFFGLIFKSKCLVSRGKTAN